MIRFKYFVAALVLAATAAITSSANAQTLKVVGAGSSGIWQAAAVGAFNLAGGSGSAHHCTASGQVLRDTRTGSNVDTKGNLWVVWDNSTPPVVWADISVDSTVGNRAYFANPRNTLVFPSGNPTCANLIEVFGDGPGTDTSIPTNVFNALSGAGITAAFTDIRPEDAKAAETTAENAGYSVTNPIKSAYSTAQFPVIKFNISGNDPYNSSNAIPAYTTVPVGASPIVFFANATNANGLGQAGLTDITTGEAQAMFSGNQCDTAELGLGGTDVAVHVAQREPLSGTMNTAEFTVFKASSGPGQETGVSSTTDNPLSAKQCTNGTAKGDRNRAIGTGEMVNTAVKNNADTLGYAFFSYGNFSKIANNSSYKYLTLDGIDPINSTYGTGQLPKCGNGTTTFTCGVTAGSSFPNLRNGTYLAWSLLRIVTDASGSNLTAVNNLAKKLQDAVNSTVPDMVPFVTSDHSDGLAVYRSHFTQSGVTGNNGSATASFGSPSQNTLGGGSEAGGDVGGCVEGPFTSPSLATAPGTLNCKM